MIIIMISLKKGLHARTENTGKMQGSDVRGFCHFGLKFELLHVRGSFGD
jgi:hypothetical protein